MTDHDQYNRWFRRVRTALELSRRDVVEILSIGGVVVTPSRVDGGARSQADERRRMSMSLTEWEAFTIGLVEWSRAQGRGRREQT